MNYATDARHWSDAYQADAMTRAVGVTTAAMLLSEYGLELGNPYHDSRGRFSSAEGAGGAATLLNGQTVHILAPKNGATDGEASEHHNELADFHKGRAGRLAAKGDKDGAAYHESLAKGHADLADAHGRADAATRLKGDAVDNPARTAKDPATMTDGELHAAVASHAAKVKSLNQERATLNASDPYRRDPVKQARMKAIDGEVSKAETSATPVVTEHVDRMARKAPDAESEKPAHAKDLAHAVYIKNGLANGQSHKEQFDAAKGVAVTHHLRGQTRLAVQGENRARAVRADAVAKAGAVKQAAKPAKAPARTYNPAQFTPDISPAHDRAISQARHDRTLGRAMRKADRSFGYGARFSDAGEVTTAMLLSEYAKPEASPVETTPAPHWSLAYA